MTTSKTEKQSSTDEYEGIIDKEYTYIKGVSGWRKMLISAERYRQYADGRVEPMPFKAGEVVEP